MTQIQQLGKDKCQRLVTNGLSLTACVTAWTFIHQRVKKKFKKYKILNPQVGDSTWKVRRGQVRGSDKDREPELQNSDSHLF
jgi:hypothetical protein